MVVLTAVVSAVVMTVRGDNGCGGGDDDSEPSRMAAAAKMNMKSVRLEV